MLSKGFLKTSPRVCFLVGTMVFLSGCPNKKGTEATRVSGGGATFVDPIMQKWSQEYKQIKGLEVDYKKSGSGNGIQQMTGKVLDFGCTDAPMNKEQTENALKEAGEVIHVPVTIGAVVLAFNVEGVDSLQLTGEVVADIYSGKITKWNDPRIVEINPGTNFPDKKIVAVYRAESSGTSNIFSEYLGKVSPEFKEKVGVGTNPKWPQGIGLGQPGNDGIAGYVKNNPNTIGYVELLYAKQNKIKYASIRNKAGKFITPTPEAASTAATAAMKVKQENEPYSLHELTYSLTNAEGEQSYPICGMSYAILYKNQSRRKGKPIVEFLKWATSEGQKFATELDYAPLPAELTKAIAVRLDQVEFVD